MRRRLRPIISLFLLFVAISVGVYYLAHHKNLVDQLGNTPLLTTSTVLLLYLGIFGALLLILSASIRICNRQFGRKENVLLNAHSLFINFFIPGQGGPAYRGIYFYKRHGLKVRNYAVVTLLYYAFYAVISVFLLLLYVRPLWQTLLGVILIAGACMVIIKKYSSRAKIHKDDLNLSGRNVLYLLLATGLQIIIFIAIYGTELHSVNKHIALSQVITYTGTANLALFVSLTPGAIGIRESFLIFTEHLNHISSANIVIANVIDRSVYLAFLLLLMVLTVVLHLKGRLQLKKLPLLIKQSLKQPDA